MGSDSPLRRSSALIASGRLLLGAVVFLFPSRAARFFGFPAAHDTATARVLGRLYAIREALFGVHLIHEARSETGPQPFTVGMNLAIDATDAAMLGAVLARREGIDRAAAGIAAFAATVSVVWLRLFRLAAASRA